MQSFVVTHSKKKMNLTAVLVFTLMFALVLSSIFLVTTVFLHAASQTYYVDSVAGNDSNAGTSEALAWKSVTKVNSTLLNPGDKILFKKGCTFTGPLEIKYSKNNPNNNVGTAASPIIIDMYGTAADKPLIEGTGAADSSAVLLQNVQYIEINNLKVRNYSSTTSNRVRGIYINANETSFSEYTDITNPKILNHIYVRNCEVYDLNYTGFNDMADSDKVWGGNYC